MADARAPEESAPNLAQNRELSEAELEHAAGGLGIRGFQTSILRSGKGVRSGGTGGGSGGGSRGGIGGIRG